MAPRSHALTRLLLGFGLTACGVALAAPLAAQTPPDRPSPEFAPPPPPHAPPPAPPAPPAPPPKPHWDQGKPTKEMWKNLSEAEREELRQRRKSMREEIHRRVEQVLAEIGLAPDSPERDRIKRAYLEGRREIERKIFEEMQQVRQEREKLLIEKLRQELKTNPAPQPAATPTAPPETQKEPSSNPSSD